MDDDGETRRTCAQAGEDPNGGPSCSSPGSTGASTASGGQRRGSTGAVEAPLPEDRMDVGERKLGLSRTSWGNTLGSGN